MYVNISSSLEETAALLHLLGQPNRLAMLLVIGEREICVCHLEALLQERQAVISQNLMALRKRGLVITRRSGRHIFYRLADARLLDVLRQAALTAGICLDESQYNQPIPGCICPFCSGVDTCA
ncbi:MAG TPA: metalloregulator ArsR/SmtB family transcription factor [Longilinea sp.]|nr:metalloregulator ArsR/SmtB family transcription factor [Longilinea sp.]